jgi:hypothetical protein
MMAAPVAYCFDWQVLHRAVGVVAHVHVASMLGCLCRMYVAATQRRRSLLTQLLQCHFTLHVHTAT